MEECNSLVESPSYQCNNLSYNHDTDSLCFVKNTEVFVHAKSSLSHKKIATRASAECVCTAAFVSVEGLEYLVLASSVGIQVWTTDGETLRYFSPIADLQGASSVRDDDMQFTQGIGAINSGYICVGTSWGNIVVLTAKFEDDGEVKFGSTIHGKTSTAISAIAASNDVMASGNESGDISFYECDGDFEPIFHVPGTGAMITSIVSRECAVAAALSTGTVKVFRSDAREQVLEINAHARSIMSLHLHEDVMVSCGDDSIVSVWTFSNSCRGEETTISLVESQAVMNRMLVGAAFTGTEVITLAYDDQKVYSKNMNM